MAALPVLEPHASAFRDMLASGPSLYDLSEVAGRRIASAGMAQTAPPLEAVSSVRDVLVPCDDGQLPLRLYYPSTTLGLPILVYIHGGGFVYFDLDDYDPLYRLLANRSGCIVAALSYRLAPEFKFPTAVYNCFAGAAWVEQEATALGGDPTRLAIAGDSAGGQLAAAVTLLARDRGPRWSLQALLYPATDWSEGWPSMREVSSGPLLLTRDSFVWSRERYLRTSVDADDPLASPLRAPSLDGLPPALIITAEVDPLRDMGEAYARRLQASGVPAELHRYAGQIHGCCNHAGVIPDGIAMLEEIAARVKTALMPETTHQGS